MILFRRTMVAGLSLVAFAGCTDSVAPIDEFPTFYGTWADRSWSGDAYATLVSGGAAGDTLYVGGSSPSKSGQFAKETIIAKLVIHGTGTYLLGPGDAKLEELVGGDVVAATYSTTVNSVGRVAITSYGGVNGLVEGKIQFDAETTSPYGSYGSKASLRDAFFTAAVKAIPQN